jgi:ferredoxin
MATTVTIELDGQSHATEHRAGTTILQTARSIGLNPPYSCEAGNCATCMAQITVGTVEMLVNDVLTDQDLADGFVLTCQSIPTSEAVCVTYDF